jgi:hypothetical protein
MCGVLDPAEYVRLASVFGTRAGNAALAFDRLDQDQNGVLYTAERALAIIQFFTSRVLVPAATSARRLESLRSRSS